MVAKTVVPGKPMIEYKCTVCETIYQYSARQIKNEKTCYLPCPYCGVDNYPITSKSNVRVGEPVDIGAKTQA